MKKESFNFNPDVHKGEQIKRIRQESFHIDIDNEIQKKYQKSKKQKKTDMLISQKEDKDLTNLPFGIQKPYKKNMSKQQILPNLTNTSANNKIVPNLISHKSKQQLMNIFQNKVIHEYNKSQSQVQLRQLQFQQKLKQKINFKPSFNKANQSFSQVNINLCKDHINLSKEDMNLSRGHINHPNNKQQYLNLNVESQMLQNHNHLSKHFQQHLNYQYESLRPNLQNKQEKDQLMRKQSIYIYIRKYLNAAYGQQGQLPKMRMKNANMNTNLRYEQHLRNRKSISQLETNNKKKSPQNGSRLSKIINAKNKSNKSNIQIKSKKRIQSNINQSSKARNDQILQLKKNQYSRSFYLNKNYQNKIKNQGQGQGQEQQSKQKLGKKSSFRLKVNPKQNFINISNIKEKERKQRLKEQNDSMNRQNNEYYQIQNQNDQNLEQNQNPEGIQQQDLLYLQKKHLTEQESCEVVDEDKAKLTVELQQIQQQQLQLQLQISRRNTQKTQENNNKSNLEKKQHQNVKNLSIIQSYQTQCQMIPIAELQISQIKYKQNKIQQKQKENGQLQRLNNENVEIKGDIQTQRQIQIQTQIQLRIDHQKQFSSLMQNQRNMIENQKYLSDAKISFEKYQLKQLQQIYEKQSSSQFDNVESLSSQGQKILQKNKQHLNVQVQTKIVEKINVSIQMSQKTLQERAIQCEQQSQKYKQQLQIQNPILIQVQIETEKPQTKDEQILCDIEVKQNQQKQIIKLKLFQQQRLKQKSLQRQRQREVQQKIYKIKKEIETQNQNKIKNMKHSLKDIISTVKEMNGRADKIQQKFEVLKKQDKQVQSTIQMLSKFQQKNQQIKRNNEKNEVKLKMMTQKCQNLGRLNEKFKKIKIQQSENRKKQIIELKSAINQLQEVKEQKIRKSKSSQKLFTSPITKVRQYRYQAEDKEMYPITQTMQQCDQISQQKPLDQYYSKDFNQNSTNIVLPIDIMNSKQKKLSKWQDSDKYIKISQSEFQLIKKMQSYNKQKSEDQISVSINEKQRVKTQIESNSISISQHSQQSQTSSELFGDYLYNSSLYQSRLKQNLSFDDTSQSNKKLESKFTQTRKEISKYNERRENKLKHFQNDDNMISIPGTLKSSLQDDQYLGI